MTIHMQKRDGFACLPGKLDTELGNYAPCSPTACLYVPIIPRYWPFTIFHPIFGTKWGTSNEEGNIFHSIWYRCLSSTDMRLVYRSLFCAISRASLPHLPVAQTYKSNMHFWAVLHEQFSISYTFQASICLNIVCALQIAWNLCFRVSLNDFSFHFWKGNTWPWL